MSNKDLDVAMGVQPTVPIENPDEALKATVSNTKRRQIQREEELEEVNHQASVAEAKKKKTTAEASVEQVAGAAPSGFQAVQTMMLERQEELKHLREKAEVDLDKQGYVSEGLRQQVHEAQIENIRLMMKAEIEMLKAAPAANPAQTKGLQEFVTEARFAAEAFGYGPKSSGDPNVEVTLTKMSQEHEIRMTEIKRLATESDRNFTLQFEEIKQARIDRQAEMDAQKEKYAAVSNIIPALGAAMAQGLLAEPETPAGEPAPVQHKAPKGKKIKAGYGDTGEIPCPTEGCTGILGVGPTARSATCAGCGLNIPITRVSKEPAQTEQEPGAGTEEDEEEAGGMRR